MDDERLMTTRDVAEKFQVQEATVRTWVRTGLLPSMKLGGHTNGHLRFKKSDVDALQDGFTNG